MSENSINARILYQKVNNKNISRKNFIVKLIEEIQQLPKDFETQETSKKRKAKESASTPKTTKKAKIESSQRLETRRQCQINGCRNKSYYTCCECARITCGKCCFIVNPLCCKLCKN